MITTRTAELSSSHHAVQGLPGRAGRWPAPCAATGARAGARAGACGSAGAPGCRIRTHPSYRTIQRNDHTPADPVPVVTWAKWADGRPPRALGTTNHPLPRASGARDLDLEK